MFLFRLADYRLPTLAVRRKWKSQRESISPTNQRVALVTEIIERRGVMLGLHTPQPAVLQDVKVDDVVNEPRRTTNRRATTEPRRYSYEPKSQ